MSVPQKTRNGNIPARRSKRFGSADIAALLGLEDAFESPYSMAYRKIHDIESSEETPAMRLGRVLEPFILSEYQLRYDAGQIIREQAHHVYKAWPVASATLDAIEIDAGSSEPVDIEAKTTRDFGWKELPLPYQAQMQWQMGVSGLRKGKAVVLYKPRSEIDVFELDFDEDLFGKMIETAREFWERHIEAGILPEADGHAATTRTLNLFQASDESIEIDDISAVLTELAGVKAAKKTVEAHEEALENKIKARMQTASVGTIGGRPAVTWKSSKSSRIDTKALKAEAPEIAEKYLIESESRRFLIAKAFSTTKESE